MHRSGTSALTRVLGMGGAALPKTPLDTSEFNARGYYESTPILDLHEEMLGALGTSWHDLSPLAEGWERSGLVAQFVERMAEVVLDEFGNAPLIAVKDPRICRLVPFWIQVLGALEVDPCFVIPVRNPLEVSASLARSEGVDEQRGRLLWLQHVLCAERDTRGKPRTFVTYDQLLTDWRSVVERISGDLDLAFPRMGRRAEAEIDDFLTDTLRHHISPSEGIKVRADVGEWVRKAYAWTQRASKVSAGGKKLSAKALDSIAAAFGAAEEAFGPVVASAEHRRREEADNASRLREDADRLREELDHRGAQLTAIEAQFEAQSIAPTSVEARMNELVGSIRMLVMWLSNPQSASHGGGEQLEVILSELKEVSGERLDAPEMIRLSAAREAEDELHHTRRRIRDLEARLNDEVRAVARLRPLESEVNELRQGMSRLDATLSEREQELVGLRRFAPEVELLRERVVRAGQDELALRSALSNQGAEFDRIKRALREKTEEAAETSERLAAMVASTTETTTRLEGEVVRLEGEIADRDQANAILREEVACAVALESESSRENEKLSETAAKVPGLEEALRHKASELKVLHEDGELILRLRARILESEAALSRAREELGTDIETATRGLRAALEEREAEVAQLRVDALSVSSLSEQLIASEAALELAEEETNQLRAEKIEAEALAAATEAAAREVEAAAQAAAAAQAQREIELARLPGGRLSVKDVESGSAESPSLRNVRNWAKVGYWGSTFQLTPRLREQRIVERLRASGLFDEAYYRMSSPDLANDAGDLLAHYVTHGADEGRNPNAAFDTEYYVETNPDVRSTSANPLDHFASHGWKEGRNPHPYFDVGYYLAVNPDVVESGENPLHHWLDTGCAEYRSPTRGASKLMSELRASKIGDALTSARTFDSDRQGEGAIASDGLRGDDDHPREEIERGAASGTSEKRGKKKPQAVAASPKLRFEIKDLKLDVERVAEPDDPIVVVVSHELPYPPRAGNQYRIHRYIAWLQQRGYQVLTVHCPLPGSESSDELIGEAAHALKNLVVVQRDGRLLVSVASHVMPLIKGLSGTSVEVLDPELPIFEGEGREDFQERVMLERAYCPDVLARALIHINQGVEGRSVVITAYAFVTRYLSRLSPETLTVIDTIDVFSSKEEKVDAFGVTGELRVTELQERELLMRGQITMAIQEREGREFARIAPARPVLTVGVDYDCAPDHLAERPPAGSERRIALVGSGNAMNVKGANDFLRHCWPLIRRDHPEVRLSVVGAVGRSLPAETPGVDVLGIVESLEEIYQSADVVINPTAAGTGLKIKTLEALAHHRRIVTWPNGVEGVPESLVEFCSVVSDWYQFYLAVSEALQFEPGEPVFSVEARALIAETLSSESVYRLLGDAIDEHCRGSHAEGRLDHSSPDFVQSVETCA